MSGSMAEVIAAVRGAIDACTRRRAELVAAADKTRQVLARLTAVTAGSAHPAPGDTCGALRHSIQELDESAANAFEAIQCLTAYLAALEGGGVDSSGTTSQPVQPPGRPTEDAPSRPVRPVRLPNYRPGQIHPDAVADIKNRVGYPRNAEGRTSARGVLYDRSGARLNDEPVKPYRKGEQPHRPELTPAFNNPDNTTTAWHTEANAAQMIRDGSLLDASMYLNVPLCGKRAPGSEYPDPKGCYANFRHTIPDGTTAYVVVVPEHGRPYRMKVFGTGKGINNNG